MRVPKVRSRSGSPQPFRSSVAPLYVRRCASLDAAIPWLYLHGVSTGQMRQAVAALVGEQAVRGLSANVVSRLKRRWTKSTRSGAASAWTTSGFRWAGAQRNPGAGSVDSATSRRSSRESGSTTPIEVIEDSRVAA